MSVDLIKLAETLEAAADIIDEQATKLASVDEAERVEKLAALRGRIEPLLDPDAEITDEVLAKVAADESLSGLLDSLAGGSSEGLAAHATSSLGDAVPGQEKVASAKPRPTKDDDAGREKIAAQVQEAERALLDFCRT